MISPAIRDEFPTLQRADAPIFLDNACMTLKPQAVIDAVTRWYVESPYCAGRAVYEGSQRVEEMAESARAKLAGFLGGSSEGLVWTKNATEAINLVAKSYPIPRGGVVLTTDREHNSNLVPWQLLPHARHEVVPAKPDGSLDLDAWRERLSRRDVALVAAVHVSNLDGDETPAKELCALAHEFGASILLDGAQAAGHAPVDLARLGADYYAISAHKMLAPTGVGALLATPEALAQLSPFMVGGDTVARTTYDKPELLEGPSRFEAGIQNYAGIAGIEPALALLSRIGMSEVRRHENALGTRAAEKLAQVEGVRIVGRPHGILPLALERVDPHALAILLEDKHRILVRSGDHCLHSWFNAHGVPGALRASFAIYNTVDEADAFSRAVADLMAQLNA